MITNLDYELSDADLSAFADILRYNTNFEVQIHSLASVVAALTWDEAAKNLTPMNSNMHGINFHNVPGNGLIIY